MKQSLAVLEGSRVIGGPGVTGGAPCVGLANMGSPYLIAGETSLVFAEVATAAESFWRRKLGEWSRVFAEAVGATDLLSRRAAVRRAVAEAAGASDLLNRVARLSRALSETGAVRDHPLLLRLRKSWADAAHGSEALRRLLRRGLGESASILESVRTRSARYFIERLRGAEEWRRTLKARRAWAETTRALVTLRFVIEDLFLRFFGGSSLRLKLRAKRTDRWTDGTLG